MFSSRFKNTLINTNKNIYKQFLDRITISTKCFSENCFKSSSVKNLEVNKSININIEKKSITENSHVIFFDFQSTTPIDPRVLDAMLPYMTNEYGNPHSKSHQYGWNAEKAVEKSRKV